MNDVRIDGQKLHVTIWEMSEPIKLIGYYVRDFGVEKNSPSQLSSLEAFSSSENL